MSGATVATVHGGSGPPLLLLHGYPQTHVMFRDSTREFATVYFWWYFLIQPASLPETLIGNRARITSPRKSRISSQRN